MLTSSRCLMSLGISQACRIMGFAAPPVEKRMLKRRYVELVQKHHPDQGGPGASAERMASVTEAYKTLQRLLDDGRHRRVTLSSTQHNGHNGSSSRNDQDDMNMQAASFVAPGVALSTSGWTLPWQRGRTKSSRQEQERQLHEHATSLFDFLKRIRAMEREELARAERLKSELKSSEGSHGFTVEHFEEMRSMQKQTASWTRRRHSLPLLIWRYHRERLARAPKRCWETVRYILFGQ
ncbi:hypothetical protein BCY84_05374 [Trypanosoma cruzi cruzi]|uniref:J domain-containing protein n=1 Tax=Trypanosoma cruzi TaxID=5693 RepID=A0A2V2VIY5_TRYCR|nr:hypothetical protein BCY84_05374 [Trypanosoma cruzi cruzi]PWU95616.1 hypothetical protein C4B63_21g50 [Trypanosoma cruzi]